MGNNLFSDSLGRHPQGEAAAAADSLLGHRRFLRRHEPDAPSHAVFRQGADPHDAFYRKRWAHDKVVHSTHGINCTGSCAWKVYVKDGIITWETQEIDYPTLGPDSPEYEPRGCPRGAAFSWYTYSPTRVRYPYIRGVLLDFYREARKIHGDPVSAWESIVETPKLARLYKEARGKGGLVRTSWAEATEIAAAAHVYTIKRYGPDRIAGFSPIPAKSMVSHGAGARFISMLGGALLSFYDWYADLPMASPQVFGDQTDVPESADWYAASYLIMWGSNVPVTRTPDAHFMAEARYRGQKVIVVSPDYADNTKFADLWVAPHPGTDAALAMAMGHVILKEFLVDRKTPRFIDYLSRFTDAPYLVNLQVGKHGYQPGKFLTAADLEETAGTESNAHFKPVLLDTEGSVRVPPGSLGHRFSEADQGRWNLDLGDISPLLSIADHPAGNPETAEVAMPRFDEVPEPGQEHQGAHGMIARGVPVRRIGGKLVTTVFDLMLAQYGVPRTGLPGQWPSGYDDPSSPGTPAWQEEITSVPAAIAERIGREFAENAEASGGRSMILMGAGTNHWFHSDTIYRTFLALITMTGCQGVNGGGWGHYVGQEKCRPVTGWAQYAFGLDWARPPRQMAGTAFWYIASDQWRYDGMPANTLASALGAGRFDGLSTADCLVAASKRGWLPCYPTFNRNPLDLVAEAEARGEDPVAYVVDQLRNGGLGWAIENPDAPENFPRVLDVWRANLLGNSGKGNEYFIKHLLGTDSAIRTTESSPDRRPVSMTWGTAAQGKLDLLMSSDFRMTSTTLYSDILLPAATWYEKHDLSSTDMHPYINSFNPAITPPWQTKTDFDTFHTLAKQVTVLARKHLPQRKDLVATPLMHDSPDALATPHGTVHDGLPLVPGVTMPRLSVVERDYEHLADRMAALGPLTASAGMMTKGVKFDPAPEMARLARQNGVVTEGIATGQPRLSRDIDACEMILMFSGTTNGRLAVDGFENLSIKTGKDISFLAADQGGKRITMDRLKYGPETVITSPEWSGSEHDGRRYSAFTINVEHGIPWHTLTGRQHYYLDHDWMLELGESLPVYRPPLDMHRLFGDIRLGPVPEGETSAAQGHAEVAVRYLTPHSKWSIHSMYQDNFLMLVLSRGGPTVWMSPQDAAKIGVKDNDWIESYNRNGVIVARAVVSSRMPEGTVYMYHSQDRTINVPLSEVSGLRGGIHNALTRVLIKPSHLIGGYAQQAYAFNYSGPTGNQRDEITVIRRRRQEVEYE